MAAAPGAVIDERELLTCCRGQPGSFTCPESVDVLDELPRDPTGKVLEQDLRKPYREGEDRQVV